MDKIRNGMVLAVSRIENYRPKLIYRTECPLIVVHGLNVEDLLVRLGFGLLCGDVVIYYFLPVNFLLIVHFKVSRSSMSCI